MESRGGRNGGASMRPPLISSGNDYVQVSRTGDGYASMRPPLISSGNINRKNVAALRIRTASMRPPLISSGNDAANDDGNLVFSVLQ